MHVTKIEITQRVLDLLADQGHGTLDQVIKTWYYNIRSQGGLRLTTQGFQAFDQARIEHWAWKPAEKSLLRQPKTMMELDKKMYWPYYLDLKQGQVIFFSSREAMMVNLYGDLIKFLENYG